jgi:hypothetical protein
LASILWRLRRATSMETGLLEIQAQQLYDYRQNRQLLSNSREVIHTMFRRTESASGDAASSRAASNIETRFPTLGWKPTLPPSSSPAAFCVSPTFPTSPSIGSAAMKRRFGDRLAESFTRSKYWIAASSTREGAVPGLERKITSCDLEGSNHSAIATI